jgi:hypothetical protein
MGFEERFALRSAEVGEAIGEESEVAIGEVAKKRA